MPLWGLWRESSSDVSKLKNYTFFLIFPSVEVDCLRIGEGAGEASLAILLDEKVSAFPFFSGVLSLYLPTTGFVTTVRLFFMGEGCPEIGLATLTNGDRVASVR